MPEEDSDSARRSMRTCQETLARLPPDVRQVAKNARPTPTPATNNFLQSSGKHVVLPSQMTVPLLLRDFQKALEFNLLLECFNCRVLPVRVGGHPAILNNTSATRTQQTCRK